MTKEEQKKAEMKEVIELITTLLRQIDSITIEIKQIEQDILVKGQQIIGLMRLVRSLEAKFHLLVTESQELPERYRMAKYESEEDFQLRKLLAECFNKKK